MTAPRWLQRNEDTVFKEWLANEKEGVERTFDPCRDFDPAGQRISGRLGRRKRHDKEGEVDLPDCPDTHGQPLETLSQADKDCQAKMAVSDAEHSGLSLKLKFSMQILKCSVSLKFSFLALTLALPKPCPGLSLVVAKTLSLSSIPADLAAEGRPGLARILQEGVGPLPCSGMLPMRGEGD